MKSIVILGSTVTALAVLRNAYRLGLSCIVFDTRSGIAMSSRYAKRALARGQGDNAVLAELLTLGDSRRALIATEDRWLEFVAAHRAALESAFGVVAVPSNEALGICLDKAAFARWCDAQGLPACRWWPLDQAGDATLPALIRPAKTLHGQTDVVLPKALFVDSRSTLNHWVARFRAAGVEAVISESLLGRDTTQYSVPFARARKEMVSFVARKVRPPASWAGNGTLVELCPQPEVERVARTAIEALDFFGIGEVEVLQTDGRLHIIEINARPWVQYSLAEASRHDLLGFLLDLRSFPARQAKKEGVRWLNFRDDLYVCFSRSEGLYRHGRLDLWQYLRDVTRANAFAHFTWRDPGPALKELAALVRELAPKTFRAAFGRVDKDQRV